MLLVKRTYLLHLVVAEVKVKYLNVFLDILGVGGTGDDGEAFRLEKVLMTSPSSGWASRCFTSCSVSYKADENTWYCYYSANGKDEKHRLMPVRESLGLLIGNVKREF